MKIGDIAAAAGVPSATVRFYERRGLIPRAPRTPSGYRTYGAETARRLRFIKHAQELGFSLAAKVTPDQMIAAVATLKYTATVLR